MIVSRNWLAQYVSLDMPIEQLTDRLTMSGLNLEEYHEVTDGVAEPDVAIDLEVTSNRADCLGHIGVAREVSVLFDSELRMPDAEAESTDESASDVTSVQVECPDLCHEYHAWVLKGVRVGPSPSWLKDRLLVAGINSVNNVVDITNYVMLECGQPLHAFDLTRLSEGRIVVRRGRKGEKLRAIDQREYELTPDMCIIADADKAAGIGGVMGGLDSEISESSTDILIEAASFDPVSIRSTARALRLHSPASFRFERRVDRQMIEWAGRRCCRLILETAGGRLLNGSVSVGSESRPSGGETGITLRFAQIERLLGISVPADRCVEILNSLGLKTEQRTADAVTVTAPSWRRDLHRECDLVEEVARVHGYEEIPSDAVLPVVPTAKSDLEEATDIIRQYFCGCGLFEALTLSFVTRPQLDLFRPQGESEPIAVEHSSRAVENCLRQSLIPSLLQSRRQNERHGTFDAELFEVARVYLAADPCDSAERRSQPTMVSFVCSRDFRTAKGLIEGLVERFAPTVAVTAEASDRCEFRNGRGAVLKVSDRVLGWVGELDRTVTDQLDLQEAVTVGELYVDELLQIRQAERRHEPLPRFPAVTRDLNFVLPESVTWQELSGQVIGTGGSLLAEAGFGGEYRGRQIPDGTKSYLVNCRFLHPDRTLTTEEVDSVVQNIVTVCREKLDASLR